MKKILIPALAALLAATSYSQSEKVEQAKQNIRKSVLEQQLSAKKNKDKKAISIVNDGKILCLYGNKNRAADVNIYAFADGTPYIADVSDKYPSCHSLTENFFSAAQQKEKPTLCVIF